MTELTDVEVLHAAAALLRDLHQSAAEHAVLVAVGYNPHAEADARIAAVLRAAAERLADWLDAEAKFHAAHALLAAAAATVGWSATTAASTLPQALAVARALLGEEVDRG